MSLNIKVDGVSLDLFPNEEDNFYITKQLHDLRDLETRNATFTKEIGVPNVGNNSFVLRQYLPTFDNNSPTDITFLNVDVYIDDIPIIEDAYLFSASYNRTKEEIMITIIGGEQEFFAQLTDEPISNLFTEIIQWNQANLLANTLNTSFWVYPNLTWYDNNSYDLFTSINTKGFDQFVGVDDTELSGFIVYCKEIWQRIMGNLTNLTADEAWFNTYFEELGLAVPVHQFLEGYHKVAGFSSAVSAAPDTNANVIQKVEFGTVDTDPKVLWHATPDFKFIVIDTALGKIIVDMIVDVIPQPNNDKDSNYIRLYKNGSVIQTWLLPYDSNLTIQTHIQWQTITNLVANDELWLEAETASTVFGPVKFIYDLDRFQLIFGESDTEVIISDVIPEISQRDFVKSILQQMHLIPVTIGTTVLFKFWEDIINQSPNLLTDKVSANNDIIEFNFISNYGQNNWFIYKGDDNVQRTDMNSSLPILNKTLPLNTTKIELPYSGSDDTIIPTLIGASLYGKASIPAFTFEYLENTTNNISVTNGATAFSLSSGSGLEAGDVVVINDVTVQRMRVELMTSETSGQFKFPWNGTTGGFAWSHFSYETNDVGIHILRQQIAEDIQVVNGDGTQPSTIGAMTGFFHDSQLWVNLLQTYYLVFANSIEKPWAVSVFVYLTVSEFKLLNSLSPIWLNEAGQYFYLNKMEQFKKNKLTRIELFRIKS